MRVDRRRFLSASAAAVAAPYVHTSQVRRPQPDAYLSQRSAVEQLVNASGGYDVPPFSGLRDFKIWAEAGPPKGTLYHYPPGGDQIVSVCGAPAPAAIATQMYNQATLTKMIAKFTQGNESMDKVIGWAASELEGFMRA